MPRRVSLTKSKEQMEKEIGEYNASLLSKKRNPDELVVPVNFRVALRVNSHIYVHPYGTDSSSPVREVHLNRSLNLQGDDVIRAYLFKGKYEEMQSYGEVCYVKGGESKLTYITNMDGVEHHPVVLVERVLGESEQALFIDKLSRGLVSARDVDIDFVREKGLLEWFVNKMEKDFPSMGYGIEE